MSSTSSLDTCLVSQEIRELVKEGSLISPGFNEERVQPSSFEPITGDEIFILDTDTGLFRPMGNQSVYRTLLEMPKRKREKVSTLNGFEVKRGNSYLIHLEEKVKEDDMVRFILSSPKSSIGRTFPNTRLLADYNASFDEVQNFPGTTLDLWILLQPLAFNSIIGPGIALNQLRFFSGLGAKLSPKEILEEWDENPLLWEKISGNRVAPIKYPTITNALQLHLGLKGEGTSGISALRARPNPNPIDLRSGNPLPSEQYHEPLKARNGKLTLRPAEHYLLSSSEVLKVPRDRNAELGMYSHLGLSGPLHKAGFVDNGFNGDLVFEVTSQEPTSIDVVDGMPIGELHVFRTGQPDKSYGRRIRSNYQGQRGPRTSKFFGPFDFEMAAKNAAKLDREVLVQDANILLRSRRLPQGFEPMNESEAQTIFENIEERGFYHSRYDCEGDSLVLQIIPYCLVFGPDQQVFSYTRASNIKDYGDRRLFGKDSLGLGGHIARTDAPNHIKSCLRREVFDEEIESSKRFSRPRFLGTLYQPDNPVDQVHFGLVFATHTKGDVNPKEASIPSGKMMSIRDIKQDATASERYETWSRVLIPHLPEMYRRSKPT